MNANSRQISFAKLARLFNDLSRAVGAEMSNEQQDAASLLLGEKFTEIMDEYDINSQKEWTRSR
jgi:hypothetical protein